MKLHGDIEIPFAAACFGAKSLLRAWHDAFSARVMKSRSRCVGFTRRRTTRTDATLDDLREAVTTLEDAGRIARRVLGGAHPITMGIERHLRNAQAALRARETPPRVTSSRDPSRR